MQALTATTLMQIALLATAGGEYQEAYTRADGEGKPLLVLVCAPWCPGCRIMQEETLPDVRRAGGLDDVVFTEVDADAKPELSSKLLRGNAIPQLVLYTRVGKTWRRTQLTGAHSAEEIREFLEREIAKGRSLDVQSHRAAATPAAVSSATGQ